MAGLNGKVFEGAIHGLVLLRLVIQHIQGDHFFLVSRQRQVQILQAEEDGCIQQPADDRRADARLFFGLVLLALLYERNSKLAPISLYFSKRAGKFES